MKRYLYENMLLFSVRRTKRSVFYELFFVASETLINPQPDLYRFYIRSSSELSSFHLGHAYDVEVSSSGFIRCFSRLREQELDHQLYVKLIGLRDEKFGSFSPLPESSLLYPMAEADYLVHSRENLWLLLPKYLVLALTTFASILLPFMIYSLIVVLSAIGLSGGGTGSSLLCVPIISIGALPAVFFLVACSIYYSQRMLLDMPFMSAFLVRRHCLSTGGMRPILSARSPSRRTLTISGIICAAILALSIVVSLILRFAA